MAIEDFQRIKFHYFILNSDLGIMCFKVGLFQFITLTMQIYFYNFGKCERFFVFQPIVVRTNDNYLGGYPKKREGFHNQPFMVAFLKTFSRQILLNKMQVRPKQGPFVTKDDISARNLLQKMNLNCDHQTCCMTGDFLLTLKNECCVCNFFRVLKDLKSHVRSLVPGDIPFMATFIVLELKHKH